METLVDLPRDPDVCGWLDQYIDGKYLQSKWGKAEISIHPYCTGSPKKRPLWYIQIKDMFGDYLFGEGYIVDFIRIKDE